MGKQLRRMLRWTYGCVLIVTMAGCQRSIAVDAYPDRFVGVGLELRIEDGWPVVVRAIAGGPADSAGMSTGDRILNIAGEPTRHISLGNVVMRLRGEPESHVALTVERRGAVRTVDIIRRPMRRDRRDYHAGE